MNSQCRSGYGVFDLSRQVARRLRQEWEMVENPPRLNLAPAALPCPRGWPQPRGTAAEPAPGKEKRPLAA